MKRKIVNINEDKCNGCALCIDACHEGALKLVDGKARLVSESYCDGLGDCLPECPTGAIAIEEREAAAYDEEAVKRNMEQNKIAPSPCACPGSRQELKHTESQLGQWPVQIKLVPVNAPYFDNAHLLIAADCTAYARAGIHHEFMKNKITVIGCPKLDNADYGDKLAQILKRNSIKSVTVLRMSVPCCGGIASAAVRALKESGKMIPWSIVTIATDGSIFEE